MSNIRPGGQNLPGKDFCFFTIDNNFFIYFTAVDSKFFTLRGEFSGP